ncbi:hypothetical protein D9C73_006960 [Collichthys lucidus]|uniref:Uncharacterized protein n=1 Tax=Collichthys lucidus TaxID=240159 RepID=A0A4U5UEE4_COLLU|nr:hypothetical protein D9C73_006960 [Collichthys lucidus]
MRIQLRESEPWRKKRRQGDAMSRAFVLLVKVSIPLGTFETLKLNDKQKDELLPAWTSRRLLKLKILMTTFVPQSPESTLLIRTSSGSPGEGRYGEESEQELEAVEAEQDGAEDELQPQDEGLQQQEEQQQNQIQNQIIRRIRE